MCVCIWVCMGVNVHMHVSVCVCIFSACYILFLSFSVVQMEKVIENT